MGFPSRLELCFKRKREHVGKAVPLYRLEVQFVLLELAFVCSILEYFW